VVRCTSFTSWRCSRTPPAHTFGRSAETEAATDLGRLVDPDDYLGATECVVRGAASVLAPGGVLALAVKNTADFDEAGGPVPSLVHRLTELVGPVKQ
jgi:hypothetical protein